MKELTESGELKKITFTIPGAPFGKQRPRVVNRGNFSKAYTPKETVQYENLVKMAYTQEAGEMKFPDETMLDVRIFAYYEIPKSTSKKRRALMLDKTIRPTKKPDWDNIGKIICDSLNLIAYHDDSAVVDSMVRKFYSENPRVVVTIQATGGETE